MYYKDLLNALSITFESYRILEKLKNILQYIKNNIPIACLNQDLKKSDINTFIRLFCVLAIVLSLEYRIYVQSMKFMGFCVVICMHTVIYKYYIEI